jgi:hypothetical protein
MSESVRFSETEGFKEILMHFENKSTFILINKNEITKTRTPNKFGVFIIKITRNAKSSIRIFIDSSIKILDLRVACDFLMLSLSMPKIRSFPK